MPEQEFAENLRMLLVSQTCKLMPQSDTGSATVVGLQQQ